ncbi:hypothetical protein LTS18_006689 [Coniosporium uncinatum]|uniref:Uncharacterized protein n=1 Tax=Coniosporium uncinatum TaxID=93489 RepID=A0ACC3DAZ9_9PEZI|nr:hypothetical protein LTS18_006689 [Coniosporium uncinatum]
MTSTKLNTDTANTSPTEAGTDQQLVLKNLVSRPAPSGEPQPPPGGGIVAWLQVVAGFMLFFSTWGIVSAFSVFQTYYESGELFEASSVNISWIGSIQCFLLQLTGVVTGPIYDRGYLRLLLIAGSFTIVFGHMMLSLSHIGLAVGVASSGSSLGGVIYPIVLYRLIVQVGFPWAVRCVGFIALATFLFPLIVFRMRVRVTKPRAMVDWSAFRDAPFMVFTLGVLVTFIGQTVLLFYISFYPADRGFTDTSLAFYITAIFNAGSVLGGILLNALSDRIGAFNTIAPFTMLLGVTILCLLGVRNAAGMIVEALVTGFFSGVVVAMPPVCFRMLTDNKSMIGTRMGQGFAIGGLGLLAGGPGAGAILVTADPLNWKGLWSTEV